MGDALFFLTIGLVGYLVGAIPFGYLVGRGHGVDIFQLGSGNIGATNVGRVLGTRWGVIVFLADFAKGALPTIVGQATGSAYGIEPPAAAGVIAGLMAFVGHLFPVYLRFRGGKGIATGAGVVTVLLPVATAIALISWLAVVAGCRYVSAASLTAALVLCAAYLLQTPAPLNRHHLVLTIFCVAATTMVVVKHRSNIQRLLHGTENKLPDSPTMRLLTKVLHVLAVGLWFGMAAFFSFPVALSLFGSFEALAEQDLRPTWFPLPVEFRLELGLQKDQGTRAAGFAISPLFDHYFLWQGICGLLATVTALSWSKVEPGRRVHCVRALVLMLALTTIVLGWPIERQVRELRNARNATADQLIEKLRTPAWSDASRERKQWQATKTEFAKWHVGSLLLNMVTIALVTMAMGMTAALPEHRKA